MENAKVSVKYIIDSLPPLKRFSAMWFVVLGLDVFANNAKDLQFILSCLRTADRFLIRSVLVSCQGYTRRA